MNTAKTPQVGKCERIVITAANGKVYDLGEPDSWLFGLRVFIYKLKRKIHG